MCFLYTVPNKDVLPLQYICKTHLSAVLQQDILSFTSLRTVLFIVKLPAIYCVAKPT